ncbi:hypothetical protein GQ44DRAFT_794620 [Phaeosphaeriaceae sp. PMI808]|nr:hypothetical protein GQ44DRAFT_794620 [Phaeosphaeriaceae sp. PMI808]
MVTTNRNSQSPLFLNLHPHHQPPTTPSTPTPSSPPPPPPPGAPKSPLFQILPTPTTGRAVFATHPIPANTTIHLATDLALSVVLREYRREVCAHCFTYNRGRALAVLDKSVGFAFCSATCGDAWRAGVGDIGIQAWTAVEGLIKGRRNEDSEMVDVDLPRPLSTEIRGVWEGVEAQAILIRGAGMGEGGVTKKQSRAVQKATQTPIAGDMLAFCVSGVLWRNAWPEAWPNLLALAEDDTPYHSSDDLHAFTRTYLHLLAILPVSLLPLVTAEAVYILSSRDSHNAFGIRSLDDDGSEFFGYGCWPGASYFNHSCAPNVAKRRDGRKWVFSADRDINAGEELMITYLSGEERAMDRESRMAILRKNWGFECACAKCMGAEEMNT